MTKEQLSKTNLAEGYAFGTFQSWKKETGKKSGKVYSKTGILIGKTVHEFLEMAPNGTTLDAYKAPSIAVGSLMAISQPEFVLNNGRLNSNCTKFEPVTDK